ncbi:TPA: hypothetical protein N0F65_012086 [Lagenidium giganteum]|uniref:Uncharacterized protein n=1 Tax=Lagenidium giganteum TaxID=4803 RepID=A0AAV2YEZ3_9STRA|nr:TPA: hypothetical protein N0F65_012086 [Lagenidium giganteum]
MHARGAVNTAPMGMNSSHREDTCEFYHADVTDSLQPGCRRVRSCSDCLNVPLATGQACVIHPTGLCVGIEGYNVGLDYRAGNASNAAFGRGRYFPSTNTTYCSADDAVCMTCVATRFQANESMQTSGYCVGADGCVCIARCEAPDRERIRCTGAPEPSRSASPAITGPPTSGAIPLAFAIIVFVAALIMFQSQGTERAIASKQRHAEPLLIAHCLFTQGH